MRIRVLLFGPAALAQGDGEVSIELSDAAEHSAGTLLDALAEQHQALAPFTKTGRIAVNGAYSTGSVSLNDDDEYALIAMVSGG